MESKKTNRRGRHNRNNIIVNQITHVSPDRNRKDIGSLKSAIQAAERIQIPNRSRLYDLYHDIFTIDGSLSGFIRKRISAITNKSILFTDKDGKEVDELNALIKSKNFKQLLHVIMHSLFWGVSGVEFLIGKDFKFEVINGKHLQPDMGAEGVVLKSQYDSIGTPVEQLPWVWMIGERNNLGLLLQCSMYALYKRSGFGDFAQYVEIFGQPVRVIEYDAYDSKTKDELRRMAEEQGSSLVMILPKQAEFKMLDGKTSNGDGKLHIALIDACNKEMAIAILGNTETSAASQSSGYAQAKVHAEQQLEVTKDDMQFILGWLNSPYFFNILTTYGYKVEGGAFEFKQEQNLTALAKKLNIDTKVAQHVPIADDYWYETYGIPKPDNYNELVKERTAKNEQQTANNAKNKANGDKLFGALADFFSIGGRN